MSQPPYPPPDGSPWNQPPAQSGPPPGQYGPPPGQYGQPQGQYGPPPGQYGAPQQGGSGNGKVIGIIAGAVVLVAAVVLVLVFTVFKGDDEPSASGNPQAAASALASQLSDAAGSASGAGGGGTQEPGPLVDATVPPDGLGDDDALDALAQDCFDGEMQSCDDLFLQSDFGSDYESYGDTCAGRQPENTGQFCTITFPDA